MQNYTLVFGNFSAFFLWSPLETMTKKKAVYLIGNPEIPIHYTSLSQVEQALLLFFKTSWQHTQKKATDSKETSVLRELRIWQKYQSNFPVSRIIWFFSIKNISLGVHFCYNHFFDNCNFRSTLSIQKSCPIFDDMSALVECEYWVWFRLSLLIFGLKSCF